MPEIIFKERPPARRGVCMLTYNVVKDGLRVGGYGPLPAYGVSDKGRRAILAAHREIEGRVVGRGFKKAPAGRGQAGTEVYVVRFGCGCEVEAAKEELAKA